MSKQVSANAKTCHECGTRIPAGKYYRQTIEGPHCYTKCPQVYSDHKPVEDLTDNWSKIIISALDIDRIDTDPDGLLLLANTLLYACLTRNAQKNYFKQRNHSTLIEAKRLEKILDGFLDEYGEPSDKPNLQTPLFDEE